MDDETLKIKKIDSLKQRIKESESQKKTFSILSVLEALCAGSELTVAINEAKPLRLLAGGAFAILAGIFAHIAVKEARCLGESENELNHLKG